MKLRSRGRGKGYSTRRGIMESALTLLYAGDWPARLWSLFPGATTARQIRLSRPLPGGAGRPCRLALLSDIHVGPTTPQSLLEGVFGAVRAAKPDVLLLGGDYVFLDATPSVLARLKALVASVESPSKLAVMGNHDLWTYDHLIVTALQEAGVTVLVNQAVRLPHPWADVAVIGLDDPWTGSCAAAPAFAQLQDESFRIVLCHSPDGLLQLTDQDFDIYLCGHTHGGHVATPWGPIVLPDGALCRQFSAGFGQFNAREVFVSRGIGGVEVPVRTFASPDVLILDLVRPGGEHA